MAVFELVEVRLDATTPTFQLMEVALTADPPPATGHVFRLMEVKLIGIGGRPAIIAGPVPGAAVNPGAAVSLSVVLTEGEWSDVEWVVQPEGLQVELAGGGLARQFTAPYAPQGGAVLLAVTAHGAGGDSDPVFLSVGVNPHPDWYLRDGVWKPQLAVDTLGD